jgi:hypothetical protein
LAGSPLPDLTPELVAADRRDRISRGIRDAVSLEGTINQEHGIGALSVNYLKPAHDVPHP